MSFTARKQLPHQVPGWVPDGEKYFITICCQQRGTNQLCHDEIGKIIFSSADHYQQSHQWICHLLLLMPDHLHGIFSFSRETGIKQIIGNWKRYLAQQVGLKWQRDFFDHRLRNTDELETKATYILMNPVRKKLCDQPEDWKWIHRGG
ncbi:MAG: transposase [Verrucomicrobia subdivision 3 bacterium]|nr:transposase [Limisphaerales bacterium]